MIDGIGKGSLARSAIDAALQAARARQADALARLRSAAGELGGQDVRPHAAEASDFADLLQRGVEHVESAVRRAEELPKELVRGELDFHEVAAQLKQSELAFDFSMQIRNKLIDAYREVMRMSV